MVLNLLKLEKHLTMSENIIICRMVSLIGMRFRCKFDAFDSTLYCYSDPIAVNRPNALKKNTKILDENTSFCLEITRRKPPKFWKGFCCFRKYLNLFH